MVRFICLILVIAIVLPVATAAQVDLTGDDEGDEESPKATEILDMDRLVRSLEGPIDPETYVLGPSDELVLILRGPDNSLHQLRVLAEGNVILPNVGAFRAAGLTLAGFREQVRTKLSSYYRNMEIDIQLSRPRTFTVFVLGEVIRPTPVELVAPFRVSHAIQAARGVKKNGSMRQIEIREAGAVVRTADLFKFLHLGDFDHNPMLREGQSVFVPNRKMVVDVVGGVRSPGQFELLEGETAADLIRYAGGVSSRGDNKTFLRERRLHEAPVHTETFEMASAADVKLQDLDVIVVPDARSFDGTDPVLVLGGGGRTGVFYVGESERLADFLTRIGRFSEKFDIEAAVLERNKPEATPEHTTFNIRAVLAGDSMGDTIVKPGDIITIPPIEGLVYVTGEVQTAGEIPFLAGRTAERYVALAGGPNDAGSYDKIRIYSRFGDERKGKRTSPVYRGETIVVKRRTSKVFGAVFVGLTSATSLILSIVALTR